jgi:hypothetical protein
MFGPVGFGKMTILGEYIPAAGAMQSPERAIRDRQPMVLPGRTLLKNDREARRVIVK